MKLKGKLLASGVLSDPPMGSQGIFPWSPPAAGPNTRDQLPSDLLGQLSGPVTGLPGGVLAGHVAGGQDAAAELPGVLGGVAGLVHDGSDVSQHLWI